MIKHINERLSQISPILYAEEQELFQGDDRDYVFKVGIKGADLFAEVTEYFDGYQIENCDYALDGKSEDLGFVSKLDDAIREAAQHCLTIQAEVEAQ